MNKKVALITDTHFGCRGDAKAFYDSFEHFYTNEFIPHLVKNNIKKVIMLGDTFDRRKYTSHLTLERAKQMYFRPMEELGIEIHILVGNHDVYFKNTNEVNTIELMLSEFSNIVTYSKPTDIEMYDTSLSMLPWICSGNYEQSMEFIKNTKSQILFGHLELNGFEMYRGVIGSSHGLEASLFEKFDLVFSGHYHHRSTRGNITYLGAPYEMTWSDFGDERGFHVLDLETRAIEYFECKRKMFHKLVYDDTEMTLDDIVDTDFSSLENCFVKVIVRNKTNPYWFDIFIDRIEKSNPADVQNVDDHLNMNAFADDDMVDEAQDTLSIINNYVTSNMSSTPALATKLTTLLGELYQEALASERG